VYEVVIRGGEVVDGSGAPPRWADVAIDGGRIVAVDPNLGDGRTVLDASGCIVTPGFVDVHTHLDAQFFWDPAATPSCFHGVTTVVLGNCGFGVAPAAPGTREYVLKTLEQVEEIPYAVTEQAVPMSWTSFAEYLDALAAQEPGVNIAAFVPHSALRSAEMGERSSLDVADDGQRRTLVRALEDALSAGGIGLASSRGPNQFDASGRPIPSRLADREEMAALVAACAGRPWQINMRTKMSNDASAMIAEIDEYAQYTVDASARLTWTPFLVHRGSEEWRRVLDHNRALVDAGALLVPQVTPLPITVVATFDGPTPTTGTRAWASALGDDFWGLSIDERRGRLHDKDVRRAVADGAGPGQGVFPPLADWVIAHSPSRPDLSGSPVGQLAGAARSVDELFELLDDDDLHTVLQVPVFNTDEEAVAELMNDDCTMVGVGDAGAHVQSISTYVYPSHLLGHVVRDQKHVSLERAVQHLTSRPAEFIGLRERGLLRSGYSGDVCVVDLDRLDAGRSTIKHDLPGGAPRLYQRPTGFRAVLVNGVVAVREDELTGARAGTVLRG
jgi:N-acyl-D-aspartate/D-glutamate deacylase